MKGTLKDMGNQLAQSFQELSPAQQERTRKAMFESVTKKLFREKPWMTNSRNIGTTP